MKRLFLILPVILACGACNAENTVDVLGVECEWVADGTVSILAKCPSAPELVAIQAETPNAMFKEGDFGGRHLTEYVAAALDSIFVNIVPDECGSGTTGYRIMVQNPIIDGVAMYAVDKCM